MCRKIMAFRYSHVCRVRHAHHESTACNFSSVRTAHPTDLPPLPNPLGFGFLRRSTAYIPVGVPEGEGVSGAAVAPTPFILNQVTQCSQLLWRTGGVLLSNN